MLEPDSNRASIRKPRFKHCFRCEIVPSEGVFLLSEREKLLLRGNAYIQVAPFLNGQHTVEEIVRILSETISPLEVLLALDNLRGKGYIVDAIASIPPERAAFWQMLDLDAEAATRLLEETTISTLAIGETDVAPLQAMLESLGMRVVNDGKLAVVATDNYLREGLAAFNRQALSENRPWMLVKPTGTEIWIGPIFVPGKTGCWECLGHRLRGRRQVESYLQERKQEGKNRAYPQAASISISALPTSEQAALSIAATEIAKWVAADGKNSLEGKIVTLNLLKREWQQHVLVRRPQCPCCGNPQEVSNLQFAPLVLQSRQKYFTADGGHRSFSPEQTLSKLTHHVSPISGIVGILKRISTWEGENGLAPSYKTDSNFEYIGDGSNSGSYSLERSLSSGSYGKGKSSIQAKVSALCESIERYSAVFQGDEARIRAKLQDIDAVEPNACMLFSDRQFRDRSRLNANASGFDWVPESFDPDREIDWSPAWSLTRNEPRYIATAYCYRGYAQKYNAWFARADSNGCAAGNNLEEAILQGFLELVERDSVAIWWYNRLPKPAVDLLAFDEPYFEQLLDYYQNLHRQLWVLDITSDLEIPTFAAVSCSNDREAKNIILGFGAHFDPKLGIMRALTEVNQSLSAALSGQLDRGDLSESYFPEEVQWWRTATLASEPYLAPDETATAKTRADSARGSSKDLGEDLSDDLYIDVMNCVRIAEAKGLETLVLNQTRPDLGMQAVKVIVPGLRHFWPRFGPGRLYEVPVQMGWQGEPLAEEQLNPQPAFF